MFALTFCIVAGKVVDCSIYSAVFLELFLIRCELPHRCAQPERFRLALAPERALIVYQKLSLFVLVSSLSMQITTANSLPTQPT
jgi:hypothetical protein